MTFKHIDCRVENDRVAVVTVFGHGTNKRGDAVVKNCGAPFGSVLKETRKTGTENCVAEILAAP